ncbi:MAG: hypothetical protein JRJ77_12670 [Deltaproteobacteria bacterium]|nr:hypothetical protein [Deltaproteobacteria bacterium]
MLNLRKVMLCMLILPFVFSLNVTEAMGQEGCIVPTVTKEVKDIETWLTPCDCPATWDWDVRIYVITQGATGYIWTTPSCGPFTWTLSGTSDGNTTLVFGSAGYDLDDGGTYNRVEVGNAECGTFQVRCEDSCNNTICHNVIVTDCGRWESVVAWECECPCQCDPGAGSCRDYDVCGTLYQCDYHFCPSPCERHCGKEICEECGSVYYSKEKWVYP